MAAAAKKPPAAQARRRDLAIELVALFAKHAKDLARIDELKAELKAIATDAGANFQEVILGKGTVKVAGKKDKKLLGEKPEVDAERFVALSTAERKALLKGGIVKMVENWSGAYYGAVTVDLF